ncbi:3-ketoacyl-ACP reductase FabG2 [Umboniibacter marinipuniceus]|uniref:3-oxoacyl-[acyl-carrier protein] reductase n=1 Tax=Umboniibacter marinipuniceus TaxID=569599 RepID=A0A3M0AIE9_9GAMM|nr:3-ketoacyl-ACP reductase FabG2 [Umboniibacter marinipuniceus]RMA82488.1 3-oxoacyl-[acyl-carrier protein] reductase [Umboniibacter marinipuniceus]
MTKTVLVTGSSRGIGKGIALRLAKAGYDVVVHYVASASSAEAVVEEIRQLGATARLLRFDVSDRSATQAVLEADMEEHGAYYGVVANAGIARDNAFPAMSDEDWDAVMETNLDGFYNVVKPCIMPMVRTRQPARIITMSSVSGLIGNRGQVNYSAAKAGIIGATKALAVELAKRKITVNCVAPGMIDTDMVEDIPKEVVKQMIPAQRVGQVHEVAAAVEFLLSDDASYITRQVISVNGGLC